MQMGLNGHRVIVGGDFERRMAAGSARRQAYEEIRERERYDGGSWVEDDSERKDRGKRQNLEARWREREPLDDQKLAYYAANGIPTPAQQKETSDRKRDASKLAGPPAQAPQGPKKAKPLPEWQKDVTRKKTKKKSKKQRRAIYV